MTTLTPEILDHYAQTYYLDRGVADIGIEELGQERSLKHTLDVLGAADRILEMGYGTGMMSAELLRRAAHIEVVEGSSQLAEVARRKHRHDGLVVHEAMFEDFSPDDPYDAVLAMHVAEHVADPVAMFQQIRTWLRPGGKLIVVVPNAQSLHRRLAVMMGLQATLDALSDRDHLVGHLRVYDLRTLTDHLDAAGFTVEREFGYQLKLVPNSMMLGWSTDLLSALIDISPEIPPAMLANIGVRAVRR